MTSAGEPAVGPNVPSAKDILVVIPVYNQPEALRDVVQRCLQQHPQVLVVDDGSSPPVADLLAGLPVTVITHSQNLGKGAAILTAIEVAVARDCAHLITLDADGQHFPEDLPALLAAVHEHPGSIIIGVRDFSAPEIPRSSRFGRLFGNFWVWVQTGVRVGDIQSGYRAYPVWLLRKIKTLSRRYAFEVEVVVRALWGGVTVHPLPVRVQYSRLALRNSHYHKLRDNLVLTALNTHLTGRSILPWPHLRFTKPDGSAEPISPWHPIRSLRQLLAEHATPRQLGLATALGIACGATPLLGLHTLVILVAAGRLRLNRMAAVAASQLCLPPVVPYLCIEAGYFLRQGRWLQFDHSLWEMSAGEFQMLVVQRLVDWSLGALTFGLTLAAIFGTATYIIARMLTRQKAEPANYAGRQPNHHTATPPGGTG